MKIEHEHIAVIQYSFHEREMALARFAMPRCTLYCGALA
jgi:hypothetical protein